MDTIAGHGICECGKVKIQGPDGVFCPSCSMKGSVKGGLTNTHIPYPTEKEFKAAMVAGSIASKATGVSINGLPLGGGAISPKHVLMDEEPRATAPPPVAGNPFERCIQILKSVPAPRDIKSYKKLMKLISTLEELKATSEEN